ncbi:hypothetical protein CHUAL_005104 [Chamberlinius hualienensis]
MERLTFYALSSPEKLDRIGEYLLQRVSRDISRHRTGFVMVAVEALDQLLVACHSQSLNLFVESFLKMVQKLLETTDSELQLWATHSFVKFSNIEEDTPSYHRRYDFFVSKFSSLCHSNAEDSVIRQKLRVAGLKGLQGVVRKTVSDDLQVNIWEKTHMDKIIPSLLFNMQDERTFPVPKDTTDSRSDDNVPATLAETCLREVAGRATFGNVKAVCQPILRHFDNHKLWVPNDFTVHTLKILVYSIKSQYTPDVMQILLAHLDEHSKSSPRTRTGMVDSLARVISIAAGEAIGPSVVSTVNSLLTHLRRSADSHSKEEKLFQDAVINALGSFVKRLPDYQKIEVMMFILSKVPLPDRDHSLAEGDVLIQNKLLKSLLKVATKYSTVLMTTTFQNQFMQPLLRVSLAPDPDTRLVVQQILHTLIDRHNNMDKVQKPSLDVVSGGDLNTEKCSRQDVMFMKKNGQDFCMCVYNNIQFANNKRENFDALHATLFLLAVEVSNEDIIVDLIRLTLGIQELALSSPMTDQQRFYVHAAVASLFNLFSYLTSIPSFSQYVEKVIKARKDEAPYLLPDSSDILGEEVQVQFPIKEEFLFEQTAILEAFKTDEHDVARLQMSFVPRHSFESSNVTRSMSDLNSISVEVDSISSSPGITRKQPEEEITVESLKKMMAEPLDAEKQAEELRRIQILEYFRTAAFEDLVAKSDAKADQLQNRLNEIFNRLGTGVLTGQHAVQDHSPRPPASPVSGHKVGDRTETDWAQTSGLPVYEIRFPELFVF